MFRDVNLKFKFFLINLQNIFLRLLKCEKKRKFKILITYSCYTLHNFVLVNMYYITAERIKEKGGLFNN